MLWTLHSYLFKSLVFPQMFSGKCSMLAIWLLVKDGSENAPHFSALFFLLLQLGGCAYIVCAISRFIFQVIKCTTSIVENVLSHDYVF